MVNKRAYGRICTNAKALVYIKNKEFVFYVKDISENGIAFICEQPDAISELIGPGDVISFALFDRYELFHAEHEDTIIGSCKVIRLDNDGRRSGYKVLGCELINPDRNLRKYVENKRTEVFMRCISSESK